MRNTKLVAGLSVAALTALGVTAFTFGGNGNQEEKKEETANIQEVKQEAEYTGGETGHNFQTHTHHHRNHESFVLSLPFLTR